jgi:hypothetical protein
MTPIAILIVVFDDLEFEGLEIPCSTTVLVVLALGEIDVVLRFPFPFCVGVMLVGVAAIDISKVDFTTVGVWAPC